jgi:hypothetical protein
MFEREISSDPSLGSGPSEALFKADLFKAITPEKADGPWRFQGIASDEGRDVAGDTILRKSLDLSYAAQRGFVNWDHSRQPGDQLGFLTNIEIISPAKLEQLRKSSFPDAPDSASVFVEGELYKHVPKAVEVHNIMKSIAEGSSDGALGLSLDGKIARDTRDRSIVKAFVHGVAMTAAPVHPLTLVKMCKSITAMNAMMGTEGMPVDFAKTVAEEVIKAQTEALLKSHTAAAALSHDEAVLYVLKQRPTWTYDLATKVVSYTLSKSNPRS